jgi:hypothetical protein
MNATLSGICSLLPSYWLSPLLLGSNYPGPTPYLGPPSHHHVLELRNHALQELQQKLRFPRTPPRTHAIAMSEARLNAMIH